MESSLSNTQLKQLIKSALIEVLTERQDIFVSIFREVFEDHALGEAIKEGIKTDPVSREEVFEALARKQ